MSNRTFPKWLIRVFGLLVLAGLAAFGFRAWQRANAQEYRTFVSPDGRFQIVVYRMPSHSTFPGQTSDTPGFIQLRDARTGRVLRERRVEMVQLVDRIAWTPTNVDIRLLADWRLPQ